MARPKGTPKIRLVVWLDPKLAAHLDAQTAAKVLEQFLARRIPEASSARAEPIHRAQNSCAHPLEKQRKSVGGSGLVVTRCGACDEVIPHR